MIGVKFLSSWAAFAAQTFSFGVQETWKTEMIILLNELLEMKFVLKNKNSCTEQHPSLLKVIESPFLVP